jgi:hypothetical protein
MASTRPTNPDAEALLAQIESLVEDWLTPYLGEIEKQNDSFRDKIINDSVWGPIRLYPWEVAVLDSPVMQRMRWIRQLGVVHWVYPTAGHSRFEHSLGVVQQVQALVDGIERNSGLAGARILPEHDVKVLRLAGLVHDCGHVVMSHVGEHVFNQLKGMAELAKWMTETHRVMTKKPSASEVTAAAIIQAPAFARLLTVSKVGADFIDESEGTCKSIAGLVLGSHWALHSPFATKIISGFFDADKLDYLTRDAQMAGIPNSVDVRRLTEKIQAIQIGPTNGSDCAREYHARVRRTADEEVFALSLPRSGRAVLEELAAARASLFTKVYFHQKVRAFELIVREALENAGWDNIRDWLSVTDDEFIRTARVNSWSLRDRCIPKRAFTMEAPPNLEAPPDNENSSPIEKLWSRLSIPKHQAEFRSKVLARRTELALQKGHELGPSTPTFDYIPWKRLEFDDHAFIGDTADNLEEPVPQVRGMRSVYAETTAKVCLAVYDEEKDQGFTAAAVIDVLFDFGPEHVSKSELPNAQFDNSAEQRARPILGAEGADPSERVPTTRKIRAMEDFFRSAWTRIEALGGRFGLYQAIDQPPIGPSQIAAYLRQFEEVDLARSMLRMLETIRVRGRTDLAPMVQAVLDIRREAGAQISAICPFGSVGDSSSWLSYFVGDLEPEHQAKVLPLELALETPGDGEIILWDDLCGKSGHASTTLYQWSGSSLPIPPTLLKENLADSLNKGRWGTFQNRNIKIAFAFARKEGLEQLNQYIKDSGLTNVELLPSIELLNDDDNIFSNKSVIPDDSERRKLELFLFGISKKIFLPKLESGDWSEEVYNERLLGYGNHCHRLIFFYNVPTITLSPLWAGREGVWNPLFPRRAKRSSG